MAFIIVIIVIIIVVKLLSSSSNVNSTPASNLSNDSQVIMLSSIFKKLAPTIFDAVQLNIRNGSSSYIFFIEGADSTTYEFLLGKHASSKPLYALTSEELDYIKRHSTIDGDTWWIKTSPGSCSSETLHEIYNSLVQCSNFRVSCGEDSISAEKPEN